MVYSTDSCFMAMFRCLYPKRWLSHAMLCVLRGSNVNRLSFTVRVGVLKRFMLFKCRMFRVLSSVARIVCVRLRSVDLNVIIFWRYARLLMSYMNEYAKCTKVTSHYAIFIFDVYHCRCNVECGYNGFFNFICWLLVTKMPAKVVRAFRKLISNPELFAFLYLPPARELLLCLDSILSPWDIATNVFGHSLLYSVVPVHEVL